MKRPCHLNPASMAVISDSTAHVHWPLRLLMLAWLSCSATALWRDGLAVATGLR
jgi:hypothetical protein